MPASATERAAGVRAAFAEQAAWCEQMGSPFTALLCRVAGEKVDRATAIERRLLDWPGNPTGWADGLPLRLCGGLHALVRAGRAPGLAHLYPPAVCPPADLLWASLASTFAEEADFLVRWLDHPPQTNEIGRGAALMAGLLVAADRFRLPFALYELGASAGLNLLLDGYAFDLGGVRAGDGHSPLHLCPEWQGPPPPEAAVDISWRRGVDLAPLDPAADAARLLAFVWADQPERIARLERALAVARKSPASVDRADAADWLEEHLAVSPEPGITRLVMHSVAWQYFPAEVKKRIAVRIEAAGAAAREDAPLAWLRFEKEEGDHETALRLRSWPVGEDRLLAYCQPHGSRISWLDVPSH